MKIKIICAISLLVLYVAGFVLYYHPRFEQTDGFGLSICRSFTIDVPFINDGDFVADWPSNKVMAVLYCPILIIYSKNYVTVIIEIAANQSSTASP